MAATSGNTHITDGVVFTQEQCDDYQTTIDKVQKNWNWMTGVNATYTLTKVSWNGSALVEETPDDDCIHENINGAHEYYPAWRTRYPDITEISGTTGSASWEQWDYFTNRRSDWDAEAAQMKTDLDTMIATKVEMVATVD